MADDDPVEALCLALREVGCRDDDLPDGKEPQRWIGQVQRLDAEIRRRRIDASVRLARLSQETGWQMDTLLHDCRRYPKIVPYVRLSNGVRRVYACAFCRQREVTERGAGHWCGFCKQRQAQDLQRRPSVRQAELANYFHEVFDVLRGRNVTLDPGFSEAELAVTEAHFGFQFPPDLRLFLSIALPVSHGFPNWRNAREPSLEKQLRWPVEGLCFDVEHNALWLESWEPKPASLRESCYIVTREVAHAPCLIPICGHRYMPSEPHLPGNPVFSVWQADIIYYGFDLAGYFTAEFAVPLPDWAARVPRPIRFWDDFV